MKTNAIQRLAARIFGLVDLTPKMYDKNMMEQFGIGRAYGETIGFNKGKDQAKTHFAVLSLPFSPEELSGRAYGAFITPAGFATVFGESTIPAPGQHGYEQRAYYVTKDQLDGGPTIDLVCHRAEKFDNPADSYELVPVIVTVLR